MITMQQFAVNNMGQSLGNPGTNTYKGQCVSYVRQYMEQVDGVKTSIWGHAVSYYDSESVGAFYDKVPAGQEQNGDILCWEDDEGSWTGKEGHIAIRYAPGKILNSNFGNSLVASVNNFFSQGYQGALRLKGADDMIIGTGDNWRGRFNRFHHQLVGNWDMGNDTWNAIKGKDAWKTLESWSDHPNANRLLADQVLGELARKDNWETQIYAGQAKAIQLETERNQARDEAVASKLAQSAAELKASELTAQLAAQGSDSINLNALGLGLQWIIKRLGITK